MKILQWAHEAQPAAPLSCPRPLHKQLQLRQVLTKCSAVCRCYSLWGVTLCSSKDSAVPSETFTCKWERHTRYPFWDSHWEYGLAFTTLTQGCRQTKQKLEVCFTGPQNTKVKTSAISFSSGIEEKSRLFRGNSKMIYEQTMEELP